MAYIGNKPANKAVVASDLDPAVITGQTALAVAPADTDEFLISDAGTLKRIDASLVGGGIILQVVSTTKTDTQTFSASTSRSDITNLNVTLTPSSSSNKVLVRFMVSHWGNDSHCQIERSIGGGSYSIISEPSTSGSRIPTHSGGSHRNVNELNTATMEVLDSPNTTSAIIYKMTFNNGAAAGGTGYINRPSDDADSANTERGISTITAMEVSA